MSADRSLGTDAETTRIVRSWLRTDEHESAARVVDTVLAQLDATPQRRPTWPARRFFEMNVYAKLLLAAAAVVAVAVAGFTLLPRGSAPAVGGPAVSPSPSPSPSASPGAEVWRVGPYEIGTQNASLAGVPFSFHVPTTGWTSYRFTGMLEKGTYPAADYRWIGFLGAIDEVSTDPCTGAAAPVGGSVDDLATAILAIPGTDAVGPTDVTVGGLPAKLVVHTIHRDIGCAPSSFFLYGDGGAYPNTLDSVIKDWIFEVDGKRLVIHADQSAPDPEIEREIQQIVDSVQFETT